MHGLDPRIGGIAIAAGLVALLLVVLRGPARLLVRLPAALLVAHLAMLGVEHLVAADDPSRRVLGPIALLLVAASIARSAVILVFEGVLAPRLHKHLPKIVRELVQGVAYAAVGLVALREAGVEPGSLLTTSALLTAVIGLSLQDTLGNVFAGLAIQLQGPFEVGDWIQFDADPKHTGRVLEISWRATKVFTLDELEVIVPNATLAKAVIANFTKPTNISRRSAYVAAPYDVPPQEVHRILLEAIVDAPGVVASPPPSVVTHQFGEYGIEYWIRYFTDQFHRRDAVDGAVRDRIWYALRRASVEIPYPHRTIEMHEVTEASSAREKERLRRSRLGSLRAVDILRVLSEQELERLADLATPRLYGTGEIIVREGDASTELYIVESGEVRVSVRTGEADLEVARLGAGQFFGEMALVTGDKRHATVSAAAPCSVLSVGRDALAPAMASAPDLAERIGSILAERQAALEATASSPAVAPAEVATRRTALVERIRSFFAAE